MKVRKATETDIDNVLKILDDFRTFVFNLNGNTKESDSARTFGKNIYNSALNTNSYACFIALDDAENIVGIITGNKSIVLRKGQYKLEIEEFFVDTLQQNTGIGSILLNSIETWAKENTCSYIELISGNELLNAHKFYESKGYVFYGKGCKKEL